MAVRSASLPGPHGFPVARRAPARRRDGLTPGQRHAMVGAIVGVHVAAVYGLLQIHEVREAVVEIAPMFVSLVAPEKPPEPVPPPPPPQPRPQVKRETPRPVIAAPPAPSPTPPVFAVPPPPPIVEPIPVVVAPPAPAAPPAPPPPPAPEPKLIPASAVQYLEAPVLQYPRLSIRARETGRVMVRVFIDEAGGARNVQVSRSSGFPRLDEAAVSAVQKARFRPYTENGRALSGWAFIPLDFELEN